MVRTANPFALQPLHHFSWGLTIAGEGHNAAANPAQVAHGHALYLGQLLPQPCGQMLNPAFDFFETQR